MGSLGFFHIHLGSSNDCFNIDKRPYFSKKDNSSFKWLQYTINCSSCLPLQKAMSLICVSGIHCLQKLSWAIAPEKLCIFSKPYLSHTFYMNECHAYDKILCLFCIFHMDDCMCSSLKGWYFELRPLILNTKKNEGKKLLSQQGATLV